MSIGSRGTIGTEGRSREGKTTCCVGCIPLVVAVLLVPIFSLWYGPLIARGAALALRVSLVSLGLVLVVALLFVGLVLACFSSRRR
jgi:hypothetical protein